MWRFAYCLQCNTAGRDFHLLKQRNMINIILTAVSSQKEFDMTMVVGDEKAGWCSYVSKQTEVTFSTTNGTDGGCLEAGG